MSSAADLQSLYSARFAGHSTYRNRVWAEAIVPYLARYLHNTTSVIDLGCGYGEFINHVAVERRYAMDLNPDTAALLEPEVTFLRQDCSSAWDIEPESLDAVFTSNFFEHLPDKAALTRTLCEACKALRPGGRIIAMGPNIRFLSTRYWDFYDHLLPLSDRSLSEGLRLSGFTVEKAVPHFLPYTMIGTPEFPTLLIRAYLALPVFWPLMGRQFLIVARKE